jgi:hypothetical protein
MNDFPGQCHAALHKVGKQLGELGLFTKLYAADIALASAGGLL